MAETEPRKQLTGVWKYVFYAIAAIAAVSGVGVVAASGSVAGMAGSLVGVGIGILVWKWVLTLLVGKRPKEHPNT